MPDPQSLEEGSDSPELELQIVMGCHVGTLSHWAIIFLGQFGFKKKGGGGSWDLTQVLVYISQALCLSSHLSNYVLLSVFSPLLKACASLKIQSSDFPLVLIVFQRRDWKKKKYVIFFLDSF